MSSERRTIYLDGRGGRTAVAVSGAGSRAVVVVPGLLSHVDGLWEDPSYRAWVRGLEPLGRVVTYDRAGTGASDPRDDTVSAAERLDELRRVIDWCGVDVVVLGWFDGAGVAARASGDAAVRAVVLHGAYGVPPALGGAWGTGAVAALLHGAAGTEGVADAPARLERATATPAVARQLLGTLADGAVGPGPLQADALFVHPTRGLVPSVDDLAARARGAKRLDVAYVDTSAVVPWGDAATDVVRAVLAFVGGSRPVTPPVPALRAVLVSDIERSTNRAAAAGDREWRHLLETHDAVTRGCIERHDGLFGRHTGDGIIATFGLVRDAVRCAWEVSSEAGRVGLPVRIGIHVGEVELRDGVPSGVTVRIADAVASAAGAGEVVVSATAREALAGWPLHCRAAEACRVPGGILGTHLLMGAPPGA